MRIRQRYIDQALANPIFDPMAIASAQAAARQGWTINNDMTALITVNIGME